MDEDLAEQVRKLSYAVWGFQGDNGLVSDVKAIRKELERQGVEKIAAGRAVILGLLAAVIALIGTVASLVVALG